MKLSIVVPFYNEEKTLPQIIKRIQAVDLSPLEKEIILVDDASTDTSYDKALEIANKDNSIHLLKHEKNMGKGAALKTGFNHATGDIVLVQDADLEYDPEEYHILIKPILDGKADVVYGSRFMGGAAHRVVYFWHMVGNRIITLLSDMFTDLNLSDVETCFKVFRKEIIDEIQINENRFGVEIELTAKIAALNCKIYEVGISYYGRTYEEGKKIGWRDGVHAIWCILKYNLFKRYKKGAR